MKYIIFTLKLIFTSFLLGLFTTALHAENLPADTIVVDTFDTLQSAVETATPGETILLEDGTYTLKDTWAIAVRTDNITIGSRSGIRENVIIEGFGMYASGHHGFWISANGVTLQDLTIQNVRNHCIQTDVNVDNLHVKNCVLRDAGEQILKVPYDTANLDPSENGIVEGCLFYYQAGVGPRSYIGGIDVHYGKDWIVRDNIFQDIRSPEGSIAEHAIHFWSNSENTLVERNLILTCDRGIGFGLGDRGHQGGIIRNNMIYHDNSPGFNDVGIALESSPGTQVYNNTIFHAHDYPNAIEYRFSATTNVMIYNNLTNKSIQARDGASAELIFNTTQAVADWFANPQTGDLHLAYAVPEIMDQGIPIIGLIDDYDGTNRPQGQGFDIGADEFTEGASCLPDRDGDGDSDGLDLLTLGTPEEWECLGEFANGFGKVIE